jgi:type IV pilus assembly protein PilC
MKGGQVERRGMIFSRRLPLSSLIAISRDLRHNLGAGIMLRDALKQQARRGNHAFRPVADRMYHAIESGDDLRQVLENERAYFPPLFISLVSVGESSGQLPEIFAELEKYYLMQQRFWRQLISQSIMPVLQFIVATFVIAFMMVILGFIAEARSSKPIDPIGFGLSGTSGARTFLAVIYGSLAVLFLIYLALSRLLEQKALIDRLLLHIPVLGGFLQCLCLSRLSMGLRLTLDSAMPIAKAIGLSFQATGNAAYVSDASRIQESLKTGDDLTRAISQCRLLPEDYVNIIAVAEQGGRVPEVMVNQAQYYEEEAGRRLVLLTRAAGFFVWAFVAILIIIAIFRIFNIYLSAINGLAG